MAISQSRNAFNNTRFSKPRYNNVRAEVSLSPDLRAISKRFESVETVDALDSVMGFDRYESGPSKVGWLVNMHSTTIKSNDNVAGLAGVDYYLLDEEGGRFKATVLFDPYFLISCKIGYEAEVEEYLRRKLEGVLKSLHRLEKEDLQLPNHLLGTKQLVIQLKFNNVSDLLAARRVLMPIVEANKKKQDTVDSYAEISMSTLNNIDYEERMSSVTDAMDFLLDMREYDVPYHVRVAIDMDIRVGKWYTVDSKHGIISFQEMPERVARADPVVMAYDIETTKSPLKFPDSSIDKVMMISYMIDGEGFLITNREIISQDIDDFEYTPKPEYPGIFTIFNEPDEKAVLERFFDHIKQEKPTVIATFNGDFFDWPFVEARAAVHGIDMYREIGFQKDIEDEYKSAHCAHMDCFRWVKRDSYLPQGSQGLKAVTTAKLGYNPIEIDPELMTPYAVEKPQVMAEYSVSDAVATYYLYMKYVHPFIFSLCNIIPLNPDEVLRKGTGTLCEMLLMVQAYKGNILLPHKHREPDERFYDGHLVESETYVGGHVESLEAGVFRSDIPSQFKIDTTAIDELIQDIDAALKFSIEVEGKMKLSEVTNYDDVKEKICEALVELKTNPNRTEVPSIYHVDVASMYPNIMTTNRLQPDSMVTEEDCASCDFNRPGKTCDRRLPWMWRGEFYPARKDEYLMIKKALENEVFPGRIIPGTNKTTAPRAFKSLPTSEQVSLVKKRLTEYSKKVYHKLRQTEMVEREAIICQRENPFYVNTVRDFRDRRYEFKNLQKVWKRKSEQVPSNDLAAVEDAKKMIVLYDSLQLAHKVILNSFYGYVMRKGSRWYSMEMAGVTCLTGATIIQMARALVERIGRPLELDTDGIWCILPKTFPENFEFKFQNGKKLFVSYPCVMLNHLVHARFTNHQYQTLVDQSRFEYQTMSDNSIFFEVDGPYRAMILPTSKEEDKNLKKRYAVFNHDGTLAELKGFEVKRRGELRLIKAFQSQIFKVFLDGSSLEQCYAAVARVANSWLDILESKGRTLEEIDLVDLISENRSMSKSLEEYEGQKSTSITTARRLAEFLGAQMVKDKGLACKYIISERPVGASVTERAIPVAIFSAEDRVKSFFLKKWLKDSSLNTFDPRDIIDWGYYWERLGSTIQKIITIPAALQQVANPVPRIPHPDWLSKRLSVKNDRLKQRSLTDWGVLSGKDPNVRSKMMVVSKPLADIEDFGAEITAPSNVSKVARFSSKRKLANAVEENVASAPELTSKSPPITGSYKEWLAYQKIKWKQQRQLREQRRHLFGAGVSTARESALGGLIRSQTASAYGNVWHIVQLTESDHPGEVRAFCSINDRIQSVRIKVPRKIYLNFRNAVIPSLTIPQCKVEKLANYVLPNGHQSQHLYRLTMPENIYRQNISRPDSVFFHPSVEGIYESQIEPKHRAMLEIGISCSLDNSKQGLLGKGLDQGFELDWLVPEVHNDKKHYLDSQLSYLHLNHIDSSDFQVFALIPTWSNTCYLFVLRPSSQSQPLPSLSRAYQQQLNDKRSKLSSLFEYQENLVVEEQYFDNTKGLYKKLNSTIDKLQNDRGTQMILAIQSRHGERLKKLVRAVNESPIILIPVSSEVSSGLEWQSTSVRSVVSQYLSLGSWISHLVELSRYGAIPLGNLKANDMSFVIDVSYARKLQQSGIVLWWSPGPLWDEGGSEKDKNILQSVDGLDLPVVNNAGAYTNVCIDLEIRNLSINTVLTAALIGEETTFTMVEATASADGGEDDDIIPFVANAFSSPALAVLSSMVREWWNQAIKDQNILADQIVNSFIHWVSSTTSLLYSRSLYYHVQGLSKKVFIQLVREFRKTGSKLIYADNNRFLLLTPKSAVENAYAYANYLVKSIRQQPLFHYLDIQVVEYWDTLLWMDPVNFGGRSCKEISEQGLELDTFMNWHIKGYLPPILQEEFQSWILDFCQRLWQAREASHLPDTERLTQLPSANDSTNDDFFAKGMVKEMEKPLIKRIKFLYRRQVDAINHADAQAEFSFPKLAGSYQELSNPVLQLIKFMCEVMSLCKELSLEIRLLRRHLLNILDVQEFSSEAVFVNPSASLKLTQVVCDHCGFVCDIDLCKDTHHESKTQGLNKEYSWRCDNCLVEYNKLHLEERMIHDAEQCLASYQLQDLKCSKCKRIREDDLSEHCTCSGFWIETVTTASTIKTLDIYGKIADFYGLKMLAEVVVN